MPTDDERREVARRLRDKHRERAKPNMFEPQDAGMQLWSYLKDLEDCLPDGDSAFIVLADLIEPQPTCRFHDPEDGMCLNVRTARPCDRDALMALADDMDRKSNDGTTNPDPMRPLATSLDLFGYARRIREALGEL